jgi:ribosomal protein S18 acetylase RimI-like enzyme
VTGTTPYIREASDRDMPAVAGVYVRAYAQPPWYERNDQTQSEWYVSWVRQHPGTFALVLVEPQSEAHSPIGGFILAGHRRYEAFVDDWERMGDRPLQGWPVVTGRLSYVWELAVEPALQRRGHGEALLLAAISRLRAEGANALLLRSSERAPAAIGLYRKLGFTRLPVRERVDPLAGPWLLRL